MMFYNEVKRSDRGSNKFEVKIFSFLIGMIYLIVIEESKTELSLEMILGFEAGCCEIPLIGFILHTPFFMILSQMVLNLNSQKETNAL